MHLFYSPDLSVPFAELPAEEAYHASNVLRLRVGTEVMITDGNGRMVKAKLTEISTKKSQFEIIAELPAVQRKHRLHLAVAPTKQIDRFEWFLEKATEIGVEEITPLLCRFSERKEVKPERLEKLIISAAKQSRHALFPKLNPMQKFGDFLSTQSVKDKYAFIAHCAEGEKNEMKSSLTIANDAIILIGPEGDFSPDEIAAALKQSYKPVSIGEYRLRTETAALACCMTFAWAFD